jgi:hypothetical protein
VSAGAVSINGVLSAQGQNGAGVASGTSAAGGGGGGGSIAIYSLTSVDGTGGSISVLAGNGGTSTGSTGGAGGGGGGGVILIQAPSITSISHTTGNSTGGTGPTGGNGNAGQNGVYVGLATIPSLPLIAMEEEHLGRLITFGQFYECIGKREHNVFTFTGNESTELLAALESHNDAEFRALCYKLEMSDMEHIVDASWIEGIGDAVDGAPGST